MRAPESNHAVEKPATKVTSGAPSAAGALPAPDESQVPAKAKEHNIHVSADVLDAAGKVVGETCQFTFTVPHVPVGSAFYQYEVSHRSRLTFTPAEAGDLAADLNR